MPLLFALYGLNLSATCNFCAQCRNSLTRDRIVVGLRDPAVIKKLCATPHLTLAAAVGVYRAEEDRDVTDIVSEDGAVGRRVARRVTRAARGPRLPPPAARPLVRLAAARHRVRRAAPDPASGR